MCWSWNEFDPNGKLTWLCHGGIRGKTRQIHKRRSVVISTISVERTLTWSLESLGTRSTEGAAVNLCVANDTICSSPANCELRIADNAVSSGGPRGGKIRIQSLFSSTQWDEIWYLHHQQRFRHNYN